MVEMKQSSYPASRENLLRKNRKWSWYKGKDKNTELEKKLSYNLKAKVCLHPLSFEFHSENGKILGTKDYP